MTTNSYLPAIVFSDLHVHTYKQFNTNNQRLRYGIALLNYVFDLAEVNKIKYILFAGDLYNLMQIISTATVDAVIDCFDHYFIQRKLDAHFIAISGNHDFANKNLIDAPAVSALNHLNTIFKDNFHLIDNQCYTIEDRVKIFGIPYFEFPEHYIARLGETSSRAKIVDKEYIKILLTHQTIASGLPIQDTINPDDDRFHIFDMVFNGHIHSGGQILPNFINVGSPMHRDAGDIGVRKGVWLLDLFSPRETAVFKDTTERFPQFIVKEAGSDINEWERKQYIMWAPKIAQSERTTHIVENFNTSLSPEALMTNYCKAVLSKDELKRKLAIGLSLLNE